MFWLFVRIEKTAWLERHGWFQKLWRNNLVNKQLQYICYIFITINMLPNISRSKGNQAMKLGHLIEYNKRNVFLQMSCRKWARETSSRPLFILKKALYKVKASGLQLKFNILIALNLVFNENELYKILDYCSRDMLNFDFFSGNSFSTTFRVWFLKKNVSHVTFC